MLLWRSDEKWLESGFVLNVSFEPGRPGLARLCARRESRVTARFLALPSGKPEFSFIEMRKTGGAALAGMG